MDIENIITALDNDNNYSITNLSKSKIKCINNDILQKLQLPKETLVSYNDRLKNYRYISDFNELKVGNVIRYIKLNDPNNIKLKPPSRLCSIKENKEKILLLCKIYPNRFISIIFNNSLVFQKLNTEEEIILSIVDYLDK